MAVKQSSIFKYISVLPVVKFASATTELRIQVREMPGIGGHQRARASQTKQISLPAHLHVLLALWRFVRPELMRRLAIAGVRAQEKYARTTYLKHR